MILVIQCSCSDATPFKNCRKFYTIIIQLVKKNPKNYWSGHLILFKQDENIIHLITAKKSDQSGAVLPNSTEVIIYY